MHAVARSLPPGGMARYFTYLLLFLAATHCTLSNFYVNFSYLDLAAYQQGLERNPYQDRVAMVPLLRAAHESAAMQRFAAKARKTLGAHPHSAFKAITSEQIASMGAALASAWGVVFFLVWYGRLRFGRLWFMPACLMLGMLYVTLAARYEATVWFPYDLPHMAVFGLATIAILEQWWLVALALFLVDIPIRETSLFLVMLTTALVLGRRRRMLVLPVAMLVTWVVFRVLIHRAFLHNSSETGLHIVAKVQALVNPLHWPQLASAFGFLLIPLVIGRRYLTSDQRRLMLGAVPCLLVTLLFGVWYETRIFCEWIPVVSILLTSEFAMWMDEERMSSDMAAQARKEKPSLHLVLTDRAEVGAAAG